MFSIYLCGVIGDWRKQFESGFLAATSYKSSEITIFDPTVSGFHDLNEEAQHNIVAKEFYAIETCDIVVFYFDKHDCSVNLKLGDAVGRGKQVLVCLVGEVEGSEFIGRYCEYRGITICKNLTDLVATAKEFVAQTMMVNAVPV